MKRRRNKKEKENKKSEKRKNYVEEEGCWMCLQHTYVDASHKTKKTE